MKHKYDVKFDAAAIFDYFGGVAATCEMLKSVGIEISHRVLQKQRERNGITASVVASILLASIRAGEPIDLKNFLIEREK
mgnify:CR=1 FL=1